LKQQVSRIKKVLTILLTVFFVASVTATAVSAYFVAEQPVFVQPVVEEEPIFVQPVVEPPSPSPPLLMIDPIRTVT
jgi:hypothetical protein